jgi:hypothetical protein
MSAGEHNRGNTFTPWLTGFSVRQVMRYVAHDRAVFAKFKNYGTLRKALLHMAKVKV